MDKTTGYVIDAAEQVRRRGCHTQSDGVISMKDQTFVFEADAFRWVTYRQTLRLMVDARTEDEANAALESAVSNCGWGNEGDTSDWRFNDPFGVIPESIVEVHVVRDGRKILEAFGIHGADKRPEQDDWPDEEARKDQGKCKELNPELYTGVQV